MDDRKFPSLDFPIQFEQVNFISLAAEKQQPLQSPGWQRIEWESFLKIMAPAMMLSSLRLAQPAIYTSLEIRKTTISAAVYRPIEQQPG